MSDEDTKIKDRLSAIFPSPEVSSKMVDLLVNKRPLNWSRKSIAPYYKEMYAKQIKSDIDGMIGSGNDLYYPYAKWCKEYGMSKGTLYARVNQSIKYLCEQMDPDGKYKSWNETVRVSRENDAVYIRFIPGFRTANNVEFKAETSVAQELMPLWKRRLDSWLESSDMKPFCQEGLMLNAEQIAELKVEFAQLSNVMANITSSCVKVIKIGN